MLFTTCLFSRTLLDTTPATVQLYCLQLQYKYALKPQRLDYTITSNYWTYYKHMYPKISSLYNLTVQKELGSKSSSCHELSQ
jgi:hypothetical protein